jgi:hypothetical protein
MTTKPKKERKTKGKFVCKYCKRYFTSIFYLKFHEERTCGFKP